MGDLVPPRPDRAEAGDGGADPGERALHHQKVPAVTLCSGCSRSSPPPSGETAGDTLTHDPEPRLSRRHGDLRHDLRRPPSPPRSRPGASIPGSTGPPSSPLPPSAPPSPTSRTRSLGIGYAGGCAVPPRVASRLALGLVPGPRHRRRSNRCSTPASRDLLLGDDHVLPDPRHRPRRLDRRLGRLRLPRRGDHLRRAARADRGGVSGRAVSPGRRSSGPPSCSPARWAPSSATCSTSRSRRAASPSAGRSRPRCCSGRWCCAWWCSRSARPAGRTDHSPRSAVGELRGRGPTQRRPPY